MLAVTRGVVRVSIAGGPAASVRPRRSCCRPRYAWRYESPDAAAVLGYGITQLTTLTSARPIPVRVAGILASTPAQPGGGTFIVMRQLTAVVGRILPGSTITFRSAVLASLTNSPLRHGAVLIVAFTLAEAAGLGLLIVIIGLALGLADRELTLARLTIMGHDRNTTLAVTEAMPAVLAAVVASVACALVLPHLIGSSINLSAFTGASTPVLFQADMTAFGVPAAAVVTLALAALTAETRTLRRRRIVGILRAS